jgi:C4-dicarboxylate-specific signal transduction histidine kinase
MVAALPLLVGGELKAVVSLYRQPPRGFDHREMTLLGLLLTALSEALERRFSPEPARLDNESTLYRLAALGVLTGGIAHEITNFSNGAGNYGQALLDLAREEGLGEDGLVLLENLMTEEHKVAALSGDLARLAQPGDGQATLNVPDIFSRLREVLRGRLRADAIDLRGEAPSGLPELPADATMLLLLLLVENAIQGLNAAPTANKAITLNAALGGEGVLFTVRDNGPQRSEAMLAALHFPPARLESLAQCLGYAISTERQADRGNAWHLAVPRAAKRDD